MENHAGPLSDQTTRSEPNNKLVRAYFVVLLEILESDIKISCTAYCGY